MPARAHADAGAGGNLLAGKQPLRVSGVRRAEALTDGRAAEPGLHWKTRLSCVFDGSAAAVVFDLGAELPIAAARLSGDANDRYGLELSRDGRAFEPLWEAGEQRGRTGMQVRSNRKLRGSGRYVRLRVLGGDGMLAVSELQLWSKAPRTLPALRSEGASPLDERMRDRTLLFGLGLVLCLLVPARASRVLRVAALALAAWACGELARGVWDAWPVDPRGVALLRATLAFVGAAAVARFAFAPARLAASRGTVAVLALCALLAPLCFYNLGHPQFYNRELGRWSFAHHADLRQYYPTAKYFAELGYEGIYYADLAALAAERPGALEQLAAQPLRDLHHFGVVAVADRARAIADTRARFSDQRFAAYQRDARWFRGAMGEAAYLETMIDFGGNAAPVWMALAHVLFSLVPPSELAFNLTALIDPVLLLLAFVAIARTFGLRTMLVSLLVFGANDIVIYGTNWSGATLRHDWLAYLGLGLCALRRERWLLGGALLALSASIRAFPVLALLGAAVPALWRVAGRVREARRLPPLSVTAPALRGGASWRELLRDERATWLIAGGALATAAAAALFATVLLGPAVWGEWLAKVALLDSDPHPASVALRNLIAEPGAQARILRARWPLYVALIAFYVGTAVLAARNARPEQAAILGLCLLPVVFYPSNYYLHLVYLLPLLAREHAGEVTRRDAVLWLLALAMCAAQYFTTLTPDLELHFYLSTVTLFATLSALLCTLLATDPDLRRWAGPASRP